MDAKTEALHPLVAEAIESHWGPRCPEHDDGCFTCGAWAEFDALSSPEGKAEAVMQEPYAWVAKGPGWGRVFFNREAAEKLIASADGDGELIPLYASPPRADQDEIKTTALTKALDAAAVEIEGWGGGNEAGIVRAASKRLSKLEAALATKRSDADG